MYKTTVKKVNMKTDQTTMLKEYLPPIVIQMEIEGKCPVCTSTTERYNESEDVSDNLLWH